MSYAAIRAAVKTRLEGVTGIGVVRDYEKFSQDSPMEAQFVIDFAKDGVLNTWWVTRASSPRDRKHEEDDTDWSRHHDIVIQGVYAFEGDGANANTFQDLLDAVRDVFRKGDRTLGNVCLTHSELDIQQIRVAGYQKGLSTIHAASITFTVEEVLT